MAINAKRRPTDATIRNVRAARRRADNLSARVRRLESQVGNLSKALAMLAREQARQRQATTTRRR